MQGNVLDLKSLLQRIRTHYKIMGGWFALAAGFVAIAAMYGYLNPPSGCGGWGFLCSTIPSESAYNSAFPIMLIAAVVLVPTLVLVLLLERQDGRFAGNQELIAVIGPIGTMLLIGFALLVIFA